MRRLSSKAKKGKSAASDNGKESAPEAETQSNENQAPSDDEESLSEKRGSLNPGKKNKRGRKSTTVKSEDTGLEESGDEEESSSEKRASFNQNTKNKRGKRNTALKTENTDNGEEEDDLPLSNKLGKEKKGQKNSTRENEAEESEEEEGENYEVEKVVGFRMHFGVKQYRIRWKGYGKEQDTWEAEADLSCPDFIETFLAENPDALKKSAGVAGKSGVTKKHKKPANSVQPKVKKQRMVEPVAEEDGQKVYEVEKVVDVYFKKNGEREFLIRWKGFGSEDDTWEPESNLNCKELIERFMEKVKKAKEVTVRELRVNPQVTNRFTLNSPDSGRRFSNRNTRRQRATYYNTE